MLNPGLHMLMLATVKKYKLETVYLGLKIFKKNKGDKSVGKYRILQEGLHVLIPYIDDTRKITVPAKFFIDLSVVKDKQFSFDFIAENFTAALSE